jgi:predicted Zn-dependent protease
MAALVPEGAINQLAESQYAEFLSRSNVLPSNRELHRQLQQIVTWLLDKNPQIPNAGWQARVIDDPRTVNAWCMPGMKMALFTGLIRRMDGDMGLVAAVMAHEISHAAKKHSYRHMREQLVLAGFSTYALGKAKTTAGAIATSLGTKTLSTLAMADASRDHEDEADAYALLILRNAGYDPRLMIQALARLQSPGSQSEAGLWDSHPAIPERIAHLEALLARM